MTPEDIIKQIQDMINSGLENENSSDIILSQALANVPMNWRGQRESSNVIDDRPGPLDQVLDSSIGPSLLPWMRQLNPMTNLPGVTTLNVHHQYPSTSLTPSIADIAKAIGIEPTDENLQALTGFGPFGE